MDKIELNTRVKTATVILLPVVILLIFASFSLWAKLLASLLAFLLVLICSYEFSNVARNENSEALKFYIYFISTLLAPLISIVISFCYLMLCDHALVPYDKASNIILFSSIASFVIALSYAFLEGQNSPERPRQILQELPIAILSIGFGGASLILLPVVPGGLGLLFVTMLVVIANDVGAYFVGNKYGGPKLSQFISPSKTKSGAIGGIVLGLMACLFASFLFLSNLSILDTLIMGLLIGISSQLGDLSESYLKRLNNAKDMGHILPGHGGIYDRIDGLLLAASIAFPMITYLAN
jgi:phosphatidate cytidylyltransferase